MKDVVLLVVHLYSTRCRTTMSINMAVTCTVCVHALLCVFMLYTYGTMLGDDTD